jgi:hypothetical protein
MKLGMLEFYSFRGSMNTVSVSYVQWRQACFILKYLLIRNVDTNSQLAKRYFKNYVFV